MIDSCSLLRKEVFDDREYGMEATIFDICKGVRYFLGAC